MLEAPRQLWISTKLGASNVMEHGHDIIATSGFLHSSAIQQMVRSVPSKFSLMVCC
jgi:hypothetical protein